ncbi:ankyrin repeat and SAM domain-containing protein 1A isoform X2 [Patella vulgata]|nr:ankyrin repeat and SAM domain-containing protein 1A isoform X2 [Patella vulgata]XP_050410781.1 ankyrin repeat and SAM domain-containing protein 1A isoform X2 [Patella vulgata]XP_050410782.1 ankyrin repeat and SAM domain-containing protein 1A isoform X2 [Patella vulgata]
MEKEEEKEIDTEEVIAAIDAITTEAKHPANQKPCSKSDDAVFDDAEEWNKIEEIVSSYGGRFSLHGDYGIFEAHMDKLLSVKGSNSIHSVGEWLEIIGLEQYENTLIANGFDDTDFLGNSILEDSELESIGIKVVEHRKKILDSAKLLPSLQPIDQNNLPASVEEWLKTIQLEDYWDTFKSHGYDSMERVVKLWELELSTVLDISSVGHRRRILASLGDRPLPDIKETNNQTPTLIIDPGDEVSSPFEHIDLYKDYTGVRSRLSDESDEPPQNPLLMMDGQESDDSGKQGQSIKDSTIHIRPPHLAHTTGSIRQWRHRPEVLIKGCCNYTSQYLGSTLVKELNGPESTQEGIAKLKQRLRRKLKKSTDVIAKIPTIMLSISYRGVKFIDAKSKKVICDHEIANIFCACQDSEHMNFFAYITKDRETAKHYCHVFSVRSRELAGEIILTLGEAFEIAYQMALKEKAEEDAFEFELKLSQSDLDDSTSISSKASISTV